MQSFFVINHLNDYSDLIISKRHLIIFAVIMGIISSVFLSFMIKTIPDKLYRSWQLKSLEILTQEAIPVMQPGLNIDITHKKIFGIIVSILFILCALSSNSITIFFTYLVIISILLILIVIDYKTMLLPDELTIPLIWLGLLFNLHGMISGSLENSVYGAVVGYLSLWLVFWGFKLLTKKEGIGYGDFKLLSASLAVLGIQYLVPMLLISSLLGIVYFIIMTIWNKTHKTPINFKENGAIPFGPYLGVATMILLFWGNSLESLLQS